MRIKLLILLLLIIFLREQKTYSQTLNLEQTIKQGVENYPALLAKSEEIKSSEQELKAIRLSKLPDWYLQHQFTYATGNNVEGFYYSNSGTAFSPSGGVREENIYEPAFGSLTSTLIEWNAINFGRLNARIEVSEKSLDQDQIDYENQLFQHTIKIIDAYLLLLINQKLQEVAEHSRERAQIYKKAITASASAGLTAGVDSSLASAELAKADILLLESKNNVQSQLFRLSELTGVMRDTFSVDPMNFFKDLPMITENEVDTIKDHPSLQYYNSFIDLSQAREKSTKKSFYPSVLLIAGAWARGSGVSNDNGAYRTDFASGTEYQVFNYMTGIALRWNLISYFPIHYNHLSQKYQTRRYRHLYDEQLLKQQRLLQEAKTQYRLALERGKLAPVQLQAAKDAFVQAKARYESGLSDLPTFTQSLLTLNRAENDFYIAYIKAWKAALQLAAASGDLSIITSQIR